ncbi:MAG: thiamine phosphate synthase [Acidobacteria bacterium]|nr:thiamine phosphate synthase [Acidobacteriota bacterium]
MERLATSSRLPDARPLLYYITDRQSLPGADVLPIIRQAIAAGVDLIQIRERDLETRALLALVEAAVAAARGTVTLVLVNDRLDVALAAGAAGLHLPTHGFPAAEVRRRYPKLLLGVSCHNLDELRRAEDGGADFAVFGPVYETASKREYGPPLGVEKLAEAVQAVKIPVLALGGINLENAETCLKAGAAGLAAISLFQQSPDLPETVRRLHGLSRGRPSGSWAPGPFLG